MNNLEPITMIVSAGEFAQIDLRESKLLAFANRCATKGSKNDATAWKIEANQQSSLLRKEKVSVEPKLRLQGYG